MSSTATVTVTQSQLQEGMVLGLGNPLLDISANVEPEFLKKFGLLPNDQILAEDKHKNLTKEMAEKYSVEYFAGGSVQNSLRVMQWFFDKPKVGAYMGCVGTDDNGTKMTAKAKDDGLDVMYMLDSTEPTGTCACLISNKGKNRSLCAYLGASQKFKVQHILDNYKYVENAKFFFTSGYHLAVSVESILNLAKHCEKNTNKVLLFALSAPYVCTKYSKQLLEVYPYIDYLFTNEAEAREFSDMLKWPQYDLKAIAGLMADKDSDKRKNGRKVIVTQGKGSVLLAQTSISEVKEFEIVKVSQDKVVDTNGAGDAFAGGFLAQLIRNQTIDVCIRAGNYAASEVIQLSGCCFPKQNQFKP